MTKNDSSKAEAMREALISLECTRQWLEGGCDPKEAAAEIAGVMRMLQGSESLATSASALASGAAVQEPIYQIEQHNGSWLDASKDAYESTEGERRRIVYAAPVPRQAEAVSGASALARDAASVALTDEQIEAIAEDHWSSCRPFESTWIREFEKDDLLQFARAILTASSAATVSDAASVPTLYQYRTKPTWHGGKWCKWEECSAEAAADYRRVPLLHDWVYEVRELFERSTAPQATTTAGAQDGPLCSRDCSVKCEYCRDMDATAGTQDERAEFEKWAFTGQKPRYRAGRAGDGYVSPPGNGAWEGFQFGVKFARAASSATPAQCANCGSSVDPKCGCSLGRAQSTNGEQS